jgi:hypothetical protein
MEKREPDRSDQGQKNRDEKSNKQRGIGRPHQEDPSRDEQKRHAPGQSQDRDRSGESGSKQPVRQSRSK